VGLVIRSDPTVGAKSAANSAPAQKSAAPALQANNDVTMMSADELDRRCDVARERKIAPMRAAEIEKCKTDRGNDPDWCERLTHVPE